MAKFRQGTDQICLNSKNYTSSPECIEVSLREWIARYPEKVITGWTIVHISIVLTWKEELVEMLSPGGCSGG